ncbi:MAG: DEAD/DEAH box helicase [Deltaproteobacteria bacterium]|nr:MAG: DEAD/DEAH box helicase [Deltaproteobacteria bacterium]
MPHLQATLTPEGRLFFWSSLNALDVAVQMELPELEDAPRSRAERGLATPGTTMRRKRTKGLEVDVIHAVPALLTAPDDTVSDSVAVFQHAARLAVELASAHRVVPSVKDGHARWRALLSRPQDEQRFLALSRALPPSARAIPTRERGAIRIATQTKVVREFIDATVDGIYRRDAFPGSTRGWALSFAEALRGKHSDFSPREARQYGIPDMIAAWSTEAMAAGLRLGLSLEFPEEPDEPFSIDGWLHPAEDPSKRVPMEKAWKAGSEVTIDGVGYAHPAHTIVRGLARASRIHSPLTEMLRGDRPCGLDWTAAQAWDFLEMGAGALQDAGIHVDVPEEYTQAGTRRVRARIRLDAMGEDLDWDGELEYAWEVVLGDQAVDGAEFAELVEQGGPIVRFRNQWVLLDPGELERLPTDLDTRGSIPAAQGLRAALSGEWEGTPVVPTAKLQLLLETLSDPPEVAPPGELKATLRPYQEKGFAWLQTLGKLQLGACLADDMGLGKTVQLIAHVLARRPDAKAPALVVCPTSVLGNWEREIARFAPSLRTVRYHGLDRDRGAWRGADVVITSYGLLVREVEEFARTRWDVLALDEAQAIKNPDSQRARSARQVGAAHRVALSGTPVENRLEELWSILEFLNPGLLGPRGRFRREVALPIERFGDANLARMLRKGVAPFLLRRVKTDPAIITDLPDKIERREYTGLTKEQARLYEKVVEDTLARIAEADDMSRRGQVLAMLTALKQICNHPSQYLDDKGPLEGRSRKLERVTELVESIVDSNERVLIFTQYREMGTRLQEHLSGLLDEDIPFLHGGTPPIKRDQMVRAFQTDPEASSVLLVSLRAGGTGLNLTAASHVIHYDRWWNPAVEDQATDRAYRIGQEKNVQVHKLVVQDTLEERIDALLEEKRALADAVVGSGEGWVTELDDNALRELVSLGRGALLEDE